MTLPLITLPKRVVYVDDKGSFLEILRKTMPRLLARQFINSPQDAVSQLSKELIYWRDLECLLSVTDGPEDETRGFASKIVDSYFGSWSRFHLTSVLIADYAMPGLNGLEMIRRVNAWPGRRILLTGQADANVAISAFNEGLIQKFIPKSTPNLYQALRTVYEEMHETVCEHLGHLIQPTLSHEQRELLANPEVEAGLRRRIEDLEWVEYVVVARPFGLLGMRHDGPLQWLQLETSDSLQSLGELMDEMAFPSLACQHVREGHLIANVELTSELDLGEPPELADADVIANNPPVFSAVFDLEVPVLSGKTYGIDDIMTPLDDIRAKLRDVVLANRRQEFGPRSDGDITGMPAVLERLVACANQSELHRQAFNLALKDIPLPSPIASAIESALAQTI